MAANNVEALWQEYLSHKPDLYDLREIIVTENEDQLKMLAWEELKNRDDIRDEDLWLIIIYHRCPEQIRASAWEKLRENDPTEFHRRGKAEIFQEIKKCLK